MTGARLSTECAVCGEPIYDMDSFKCQPLCDDCYRAEGKEEVTDGE